METVEMGLSKELPAIWQQLWTSLALKGSQVRSSATGEYSEQ